MIEIVDGVGVGSGKSFFVSTRCVEHFVKGGTVYSSDSFHLYFDRIKAYAKKRYGVILQDSQYVQVPADKIVKLHENTPPGTDDCPLLIIVDEAQDHFDVKEHADREKKAFFSWCTQSRHDNNDLIFITQDANNIDARFRRLATYRITMRNTRTWKGAGLGSLADLIKLATFGLNNGWYFVAHYFDRDGRTFVDRRWIKADLEVLNLYESKSRKDAHKRAGQAVGRLQLEKVQKAKSPMIKYLIFAFVLLGIFSGAVLVKKLSGLTKKADEVKAEVQPVRFQRASSPEVRAVERPSYQIQRESYRGIYRHDGVIVLHTDVGQYREGSMSLHGYCLGVDPDSLVAKLRSPAGEDVFVVAVDRANFLMPKPVSVSGGVEKMPPTMQ